MADVAKPASGRDTTPYHVRWFRDNADGTFGEEVSAATRYWDVGSLSWVKGTQVLAGVGGGGAATIADGADVAQGATTDLSSANTVVGILKAIKAAITGTLAVSGTFWQATQPVSLATNTPDVTDRAARLLGRARLTDDTNLSTIKAASTTPAAADTALVVTLSPNGAAQPVTATQPVSAASLPLPAGAATAAGQSAVKAASTLAAATDASQVVQQSPMRADASTLAVTAVSAANAAVTLTLPAAATGLFHYITSIEIVGINPTVTAIAAAATTLTVTTTNLPGSPAWTFGTLLAAGAEKLVTRFAPTTPIKSSAAATSTTIVAPAIGAGGLVRINVTYYTAP